MAISITSVLFIKQCRRNKAMGFFPRREPWHFPSWKHAAVTKYSIDRTVLLHTNYSYIVELHRTRTCWEKTYIRFIVSVLLEIKSRLLKRVWVGKEEWRLSRKVKNISLQKSDQKGLFVKVSCLHILCHSVVIILYKMRSLIALLEISIWSPNLLSAAKH